jgi:hypothetical protein
MNDFGQALTEFRAAYSLTRAPGLLFNMGQAALAARRNELARYYYGAYLQVAPAAPERAYVEARLLDLSVLTASADAAPVAAPADERPGRGLRVLGIAGVAAGGALAATAIVFGLKAGAAADDVSRAFEDGGSYGPALEERYADGRRDRTVAIASGVAAGALLATGTTLWILGGRRERRAGLAVAPASDALSVEVSWAFCSDAPS